MKINFIRNSYVRFYQSHKKEIDDAISRCLLKGSVISEDEVKKFEENFAKFCKRKYCIAVRSGTDALVLASLLGKLFPVDEYRYRLPKKIIDENGKNLLLTYMNSVQVSFANINRLKRDFLITEDACQAVGRPLIGDISCFSFYPAKMLGGIGKGGALVMNDKKIYDKIRAIVNDKWNNLWLDEVKASVLNVKLKYLPLLLKQRQKIADYYNKHLPQDIIWDKRCLQNYIVIVKEHDKFIKFMNKNGVEVISDKSDFYEGNLENAVRIPIYPELTNKEVEFIVSKIKEFYGRK